jgi:MOSC domain-containing protein YiiM
VNARVVIHHLFVSAGHNYFGRHGQGAGEHEIHDCTAIRCRAGWGIEGDRFYGYRPDYRGQVTFFSWEIFDQARRHFGKPHLAASAVRRNIVVEGLDLPALIGARFRLGGIEFLGSEESRPCYWMNEAVAAGAEQWLRGNGGLRARVLTDGELRRGEQSFALFEHQATLELTGFSR